MVSPFFKVAHILEARKIPGRRSYIKEAGAMRSELETVDPRAEGRGCKFLTSNHPCDTAQQNNEIHEIILQPAHFFYFFCGEY